MHKPGLSICFTFQCKVILRGVNSTRKDEGAEQRTHCVTEAVSSLLGGKEGEKEPDEDSTVGHPTTWSIP